MTKPKRRQRAHPRCMHYRKGFIRQASSHPGIGALGHDPLLGAKWLRKTPRCTTTVYQKLRASRSSKSYVVKENRVHQGSIRQCETSPRAFVFRRQVLSDPPEASVRWLLSEFPPGFQRSMAPELPSDPRLLTHPARYFSVY